MGRVASIIGGMILVLCLGVYIYAIVFYDKPTRFNQGDCLKMNFDGVESWFDNITVKVEHVGKENYGVKHWFEGYWSHGMGTWPFSLPSVKVECPVEVIDEKTN